jgi:hypothetical protein
MVIQTGGFSFAVASDRIDVVFRTQEACVTQLSQPKVRIEVQQGRPWFIVSLDSLALLQEFSHADPAADLQWTIGLRHPSGLALHAASVEGPFKGVVSNQMLKTPQGDWPLLEWRS